MTDDSLPAPEHPWDVLLLGGPSGTEKTAVSYCLARHVGIGITEVDDFQVLLERMTTPEQQPVLHFWRTHPAPDQLTAEEILESGLQVGQVMAAELETVIANRLAGGPRILLEGDFIHPSLAALPDFAGVPNAGRVRAVPL